MNSKPFPWLNLYLIFLFCFINHLLQVKGAKGNETDRLSLLAIKDHIEGLSSWNQSMHLCQWQGITCSWRHQRVVALNLSNQNLVGTISPYVGNLSFLKSMDLRNNKLYGQIPQEIGRLFRLQHLLMRNNTFEGEIPANISQCTDLRTLNLIENKLTGNIPATLGSLSKLVMLGLQTNNLIGQIPPSLGNLSSLQIFSLVENNLVGSIPATLGKLTSLTSFLVSSNTLSGEVPLSIFNISSINIFSISANQLTGGLPLDMGITLPNLEKFTVASNQLSGPLPVSLPNASRLYNFDIANNNFTGKVPSNLGVLQYFQWINLAYNNLGSGESDDLSFITHLTNSSDLQILCLSENNFWGAFPPLIVNLSTQMQFLCLGGNQLYGTISDEIGNLVNLIALGLENNMFNGSIPSSIGNISNLQGLFLNGNKLTGLIPSSLGKLTQLSELSLSTNRLEGSLPSSFGDYLNLQSLNISRNNLSNTIPKQIFSIPSLSILLDLSNNSFTGSLPSEIGQLKSLGYIDVSGNRLSGEIPSTLSNCLGLEELHMESNMFEGKIPQSLSSLMNIRYIDLSSNNLSGPIPKYLENFQSLQRLNLSFNKLEGEIPMKGIFQNASSVSVGGNFKLCGGIHELLFPTCPIKESQKEGKSVVLKVAIGSSVALFFLLASSFLIVYWRRKPKPRASSLISLRDRHIKVSYKDLFQATDGFSPTNFVGSGSFGRVYKGMLGQGEMIVAVKVFDLQHKGASKSFMAECESLRHIRHRNLVKILTSCSTTDFQGNDFKALVFEFMPNGSLQKWLPGFVNGQDDQLTNLNLLQRLNIAVDVASALNYLHHQSHVSIIHRDLKPSNILLDNNMVAHVGDFGLAKLLPGSRDNVYKNRSTSTGIKGTIGYAAPEYGMGCDASTQGDVYSYGILLLELFTGRKPTDKAFIDGLNLHNFARMALPNRVLEVLDPALLSEEDVQSLSSKRQTLQEIIVSLVRVGVACSLESPGERMNMEEVARDLNLTRDIFLASLRKEHL